MAHIPSKRKKFFGEKPKQIWLKPDIESAKEYSNMLMDKHEEKYPGAIKTLEEGLEDSLQFFNFPRIDHRKISSTNMLERLNTEIRGRTRVVGIFPNMDSYIRLMTINLMEYCEDWSAGCCYIKQEAISLTREDREKVQIRYFHILLLLGGFGVFF